MKVKKNNIMLSILAGIILWVCLGYIVYCHFIIVRPIEVNMNKKFGIIDGAISEEHKNILSIAYKKENLTKKQHGDRILEFLEILVPNGQFYYYDAQEGDQISTKKILEGLQWMNDNGVECVSLSVSSKYYSEDLEQWVRDHANTVEIYASYNNLKNTNDYPAMYEYVHGVGLSDVSEKQKDVLYKTSNIIVLNNGIHFFSGNSYLAPYTMVKNYEKIKK